MAVTTRSQVVGFKELEQVLKELPVRLAERELVNATRAGANVIRKEAQARAPRGGVPSQMSEKFGPLHKKIRAVRVKKTPLSVEFAIDSGSAFYGSFLEFGTKNIRARPWLTPAYDVAKDAAIQKLGDRLAKGIVKVAAELAGEFGSLRRATRRRL